MRSALLWILLLLHWRASAQHLPITSYGSPDGAPVIGANSIYQDRQGWLWFTDGYHVIRYDGYRFKNYYPQKKYRLEFSYQVMEIGNEIWALSYPHPFKVVGDSLVYLDSTLKLPQILQALTFNGRQYILTNNGLYYFENGSIQEFIIDSSFNFARVNASVTPYNDSLLLSFNSNNQLVIFDVKNRQYHISPLFIQLIRKDHLGRIFFHGKGNAIYVLKRLSQRNGNWIAEAEHYFTLPWQQKNIIFEADHSGNLWITEQFRRMIRLSPNKQVTTFTEKDGLPSLWFNQMMLDKEGLLWVVLNGGICKIRQSGWERYTTKEGLSFNHATFFSDGEKDSTVFIGTQDGFNLFNRGRITAIRLKEKILSGYFLEQIDGKILYTRDTSLYQASINEDEFTATNEKLLTRLNGAGIEMAKDKHGSLFISVPGGISVWNGRQLFYFKLTPAIFRQLMVDKQGNLWAGSFGGGLFRFAVEYNQEEVNLRQLDYLEKMPAGELPLQSTRALAEDENGNIVVGTRFNGVYYIIMKNDLVDSILHFDQKDGLKSNSIWGVDVTSKNEVWIGTALGLSFGTWENGIFKIKDVSKIHQIYSAANIYVDRNNSVWVATHPGVKRLISKESFNSAPFSVYITNVLLDGQSTGQNNDSAFSHRQNNFILEFSSNTYLDEKAVTYSYRLVKEGDEKWTDPQAVHSVNYSSLEPGVYRFEVKAMNVDGRWSDNIAAYAFEIRPPFWQTPWFIALLIVLVASGFYALYRYRIAQLMRLQQVRNNISRNLHDDIGASLSNINILTELAKRNMKDETKADLYLSKAGEDIQRISESLSDIVWNINPRYDDLENLFIRMKRYAADMLEGKNISADLLFPVINPAVTLPMDQRRDFYLIFKEAINNLVKYSRATQALVEVRLNSHSINLIIRDNGIGFDSNKTHSEVSGGNGLYNMKQRANKWRGDFTIDSLSGQGTVVRLTMKI